MSPLVESPCPKAAMTGTASRDDVWRRALPSLALDIGIDLGVVVPMTTDDGDNQPVFRQYGSGECAFMVSKPHNRLFDFIGEDASGYIDYLTEKAIPEGTRATDWVLNEATRVREAILGGRLLQRWVGQVVEVRDGWFTANFVTTLGGEDCERATFQAGATLSESDQEKLAVGALVEWLVYESEGAGSTPVRSRVFRLIQEETSSPRARGGATCESTR